MEVFVHLQPNQIETTIKNWYWLFGVPGIYYIWLGCPSTRGDSIKSNTEIEGIQVLLTSSPHVISLNDPNPFPRTQNDYIKKHNSWRKDKEEKIYMFKV